MGRAEAPGPARQGTDRGGVPGIRQDPRSVHPGLQRPFDPGPGRNGRVLGADSRSQRGRFQEVFGRRRGVYREGQAGPGHRGDRHQFSRHLATALCPCQPGAGQGVGGSHLRRLRHPAGLFRQLLRQRLPQIRPGLSRPDRGGRAVPDESQRSHQDLRARPERAGHVHDPAQHRGHDGIHRRAGSGAALQRIRYGLRAGSGGSRRELGSGSRCAGTSGEGGARPQRLRARLERDFLPGTECRREVGCGVRVRSAHGLPGAGRPVRELDGALCRDSGRAFRRLRGTVRRMGSRDDQRHLLPDRAGHADRAFRQERDPPRGFCQSSVPRWHVGHRGGYRGGEASLPADHHDLHGVHPGGDASGLCHGRRSRRPPVHRHRRLRWHARGHLPGHLFRAGVLRVGPEARATPSQPNGRKPRCSAGRGVSCGRRALMRRLALAVLSALLISCAMGPDYTRPGVSTPESFRMAGKEGESIANLPWWKLLRDEELQKLVRIARDENRRAVVLQLVSGVAQSYFDLRQLDMQLDIAKRTLKSWEESVRLAQARLRQGLTNKLDADQFEAERANAAARTAELERLMVQKENELSVLLGRNPASVPRGRSLLEQALPSEVPPGLPSELLQRRPDILQVEQQLAAATARIGVAKAERFPKITLTGILGVASPHLSRLVNPGEFGAVGPSLTGPLFNAQILGFQQQALEAQAPQAVAPYEQTILVAFTEDEDALVAVRKTRDQTLAQEEQVTALRSALHLADLRYKGGLANYLDVLIAQRSLFDPELSLTATRRLHLVSIVQLYKALGGGWTSGASMQ